jgi:hypothetical protein
MSLLVYVIVEADGSAVLGTGLQRRPLLAVTEGPVTAVVSDEPAGRPDSTIGALLEFEQTVERLMHGRPVLPAQFGSVLPDESAVRALLEARRDELVARLDQVRGAVQFELRARWRDVQTFTPEAGSAPASAYLQVGLELRGRAQNLATALDPLAGLARASRRALLPRPDIPVLDAYLVDRTRQQEFIALVEQLNARLEQAELAVSGPWPPYSFSDAAPLPAAGAAAPEHLSGARPDLILTARLLRD